MNAYLKWFLLLPLNIIMTVLGFVLAPVLPMFADDKGWLPKWLWWFQTPDNSLDGDEGYQKKPGRAPFMGVMGGWKGYCNRVAWLWRNPLYGFDWEVLAFKVQEGYKVEGWGTKRFPDGTVAIAGGLDIDGWYFAKLTNPDGSWCWQLYITQHWNDKKCTKLNFGWKIWMADAIKVGMDHPMCAYTFNPVNWIKTI